MAGFDGIADLYGGARVATGYDHQFEPLRFSLLRERLKEVVSGFLGFDEHKSRRAPRTLAYSNRSALSQLACNYPYVGVGPWSATLGTCEMFADLGLNF